METFDEVVEHFKKQRLEQLENTNIIKLRSNGMGGLPRINRVFGFIHGARQQKKYRDEIFSNLHSLVDWKGWLYVLWKQYPKESQMGACEKAWEISGHEYETRHYVWHEKKFMELRRGYYPYQFEDELPDYIIDEIKNPLYSDDYVEYYLG